MHPDKIQSEYAGMQDYSYQSPEVTLKFGHDKTGLWFISKQTNITSFPLP